VLVFALIWTIALTPASVLAARAKAQRAARASRHERLEPARRHAALRELGAASVFGERVVRYARRLVGVPYRWGGSSPSSGFDCSGFVRYVFARFGVALPHSSYADYGLGRFISRWALEPGDLVFFSGLGHVGLYVGGGRFIHAPHSGTDVEIDSLSGSYGGGYYGARRLVVPLAYRLPKLPQAPGLGPLARWLALRPPR
jgi:cell wall-associated NlpC family hydrolase